MKYIYTLLLALFISNPASAENWIKVYPPQNNHTTIEIARSQCFRYDAQGNIDSIDIDCTKNISQFQISITAFPNTPIELDSIDYVLKHIDTINFLTILVTEKDNPTDFDFRVDLNPFKKRSINMFLFSNTSKKISISNFPESKRYATIMTSANYLNIDTINNIDSISLNRLKINSVTNSINLNIHHIDNIKKFSSSMFIENTLPNFPESIESLSLAVKKENYQKTIDFYSALQLTHHHLNSFGFILHESLDTLDIKSLNNLKTISVSSDSNNTTISSFLSNENYISLYQQGVMINNLKLPENLQNYHVSFISHKDYVLPELSKKLKSLSLLAINNVIDFNFFPQSLQNITLGAVNYNCLPLLPQSLQTLNQFGTPSIKCIPNETPWVKATTTRPLCNDEQLICDKDSFEIINGKVFLDINNNGVIDSNDQLLSNAIISTDKDQLANSKQDGTYGIILRETGSYLISATYNHPHFKQSVPANVTVNYQEGQSIDSVHFLIQVNNKNDVQINGTNLVARPGMNTKVVSFVENLSLENKSDLTVKILKPADWDLEDALPVGYALSNDTIIWNNVSLAGLKNTSFSVSSTLPPTATILGDLYQYQMWVENEGDITPENNYYSIIDTIIGSYDPNDKIVNHSTLTPELSNSKELIYTIRFQNTGTDTAFKVVIIDTIIGNLDPSSIRVLGASHNYTWSFSGQGIATFVFDNILLPDSNVNEPGSHGFVTLVLRPSKDLVIGDSIYNRAGIYFDFNEPVITNHANTKIATVTPVYSPSNIPLSIYPNPAKNQVRVEWKVAEPAILRLSDISGKIIRTERLNNGFTDINVSQLPKGLYIVQLQAGQHMAVSKLIVQ